MPHRSVPALHCDSAHRLFADEIVVPAFTAYSVPEHEGIHISEERGADHWNNGNSLNWYGRFNSPCKFRVLANIAVPKIEADNEKSKGELNKTSRNSIQLRLKIDDQVSRLSLDQATGAIQRLDFGTLEVKAPGFHRIELELETTDDSIRRQIRVESLVIDGLDKEVVHFNLKERRNAASVHLRYLVPRDWKIDHFYVETTAVEEPIHSFYMACGFHRGYFGMQINSPSERRIIFSVWDAGNGTSADNRNQVDKKDFVQLLDKGEGVHTNAFGGEGTGGHSHLKYRWKTGEKQRFLLIAKPIDSSTEYAGYYFHPERQSWFLVSRMLAPSDGRYLEGLHSFSENFWGSTGHLRRKALYGNPWVRTSDGDWHEITEAVFSHDATGKDDRWDRFMGTEDNSFFLSHGGFVEGTSKPGEKFQRSESKAFPECLTKLPTSTSE